MPCSRSTKVATSSTTTDGHRPYITARDPLVCHYEVVTEDTLPEVVSTYLSAFVYNTYEGDQSGEHWVAVYVDEIGDYFDPYGQHAEFTNCMNEHFSQWSPNNHILQSPISTVCGQYWVAFFAFVIFQCMHLLAYSHPI